MLDAFSELGWFPTLVREQSDASLWSVLNTLEEALIRGGVVQKRADGTTFRSRPVTSVDGEVRINQSLWQLAANLEKALD